MTMESGKIVYQGMSRKKRAVVVRYPTMDDVAAMRDYINTISRERTFISYQGEQVTVEDETKFINSQALLLTAWCEDKLVGVCGLSVGERTAKHIGNLGISVAKDYRGEGIGRLLMQLTLDEAAKNIPQMEIMTLSVFATNDLARAMYKKLEFVEYGNLPKGVKLPDGYADHVFMYKVVK